MKTSVVLVQSLDAACMSQRDSRCAHPFPSLGRVGVILIDDHGHWRGASAATGVYRESHRLAPS